MGSRLESTLPWLRISSPVLFVMPKGLSGWQISSRVATQWFEQGLGFMLVCVHMCIFRVWLVNTYISYIFFFSSGLLSFKTKYVRSKMKTDIRQVPLLLTRMQEKWILACHIMVVMSLSIRCCLPESERHQMSWLLKEYCQKGWIILLHDIDFILLQFH